MAVVRAGLAAGIPLAMILAAKVFGGRLSPVTERSGLIMELPPYRKPKIEPLFKTAFRRYTIILWRAFKTIFMDGAHHMEDEGMRPPKRPVEEAASSG